jgi:hypothetical protein
MIARLIRYLFPLRRAAVIDVAQYGPRLYLEDLQELFEDREDQRLRALAQLACFHRWLSHRAMEDKSNLLAEQTRFEAGAAAGMSDLLTTLQALQDGHAAQDTDLVRFFPRRKPESKS